MENFHQICLNILFVPDSNSTQSNAFQTNNLPTFVLHEHDESKSELDYKNSLLPLEMEASVHSFKMLKSFNERSEKISMAFWHSIEIGTKKVEKALT